MAWGEKKERRIAVHYKKERERDVGYLTNIIFGSSVEHINYVKDIF